MVNIEQVNADHGHDFHPLADHMNKLQNFTKGEIHEFSAFPYSLQLMFFNLITHLMISQINYTWHESCTNGIACCSGH